MMINNSIGLQIVRYLTIDNPMAVQETTLENADTTLIMVMDTERKHSGKCPHFHPAKLKDALSGNISSRGHHHV
jgi:hypothetical protein